MGLCKRLASPYKRKKQRKNATLTRNYEKKYIIARPDRLYSLGGSLCRAATSIQIVCRCHWSKLSYESSRLHCCDR